MQIKRARKRKTTQGKRRTPGKNLLKINSNSRQRKESKNRAKTAKQQSRKQSKKKATKYSTTVCDHKSSTSQKKTQGKRQTLKIKYLQRKTNLQQITSKSKQVTASQTTCTKQQRKSHKTATHFPITKAKRTVNTQEENATSTNNVFKSV